MRTLTVLLLLLCAAPAAAQEREIRDANLPRGLEWELLRMYDGGARRYDGVTVVERSEVVDGDMAVMGGPLRIAGRVRGDVAMVNGDVILEPGGEVTGRVVVVGGEVRMAESARVGGTITAYGASSSRRYADDERRGGEDEEGWRWPRRRRDDRWREPGHSTLTIQAGASYNRVEGLPLMFGPSIRTAGSNPLELEALAIWRTESGSLDTDRMGYRVKAEQFLGGHEALSVGGTAFSVVSPMDRWQIRDLEASLAAALFHDDYRDHYDRTGWSAFVRAQPTRWLDATVEYRQETHGALAAADPWTLFDSGDSWRFQPLVAEGDIQTVGGTVEVDLRDQRRDPEGGWYARATVDRAVGGDLVRPRLVALVPSDAAGDVAAPVPGVLPATNYATDFTTASIDLRRYNRVGWASQLNFRVVAGGNLAAAGLPPQYQHALGGIGSLPGFGQFSADCGVRGAIGSRDGETFFPAYGCDRFALGQVEYRGSLALDFGFDDPDDPDYDDSHWWHDVDVDLDPSWVVFFDAGRGWAYGDPLLGGDPALGGDRDTGALYDVGLGFLLGDIGLYAALPLNGDVEQKPRFFVRLGRRW